MLEGDRLDDVGDVLDGVEGVLHRLDDVLPVQRGAGLELVGVDPSQRVPVDRVALGLEAVDGVEVGLQALASVRARRSSRRPRRPSAPARSACCFSSGIVADVPVARARRR